MDEQAFEKAHAADRMSREKLIDGIDGFSKALVSLEGLLLARLSVLELEAA